MLKSKLPMIQQNSKVVRFIKTYGQYPKKYNFGQFSSSTVKLYQRVWIWNLDQNLIMALLIVTKSSADDACACVAKPTSGTSCSWWWLCYMSKTMCGKVLVLPNRHLVRPTADDDFVICPNACVAKCLCCQADV